LIVFSKNEDAVLLRKNAGCPLILIQVNAPLMHSGMKECLRPTHPVVFPADLRYNPVEKLRGEGRREQSFFCKSLFEKSFLPKHRDLE
jgi:hypothetical protein